MELDVAHANSFTQVDFQTLYDEIFQVLRDGCFESSWVYWLHYMHLQFVLGVAET